MKKRILTAGISLAAIVAIIAVFTAASQEDVKFVKDSAFLSRMRPPVAFDHDLHNETALIEDCGICHHVYEDGRRVEDEASVGTPCSECHALQPGDSPTSLVRVYHLQCKGCHIEKRTGPISCGECHRR